MPAKFLRTVVSLAFFSLLFVSPTIYAEVLQEGWHKVLSAGQHVGYYVIRYELDKKTNVFKFTSFLKTNAIGNDVTEAIKAESLQVMTPVQWITPQKYQYTSTEGKSITTIDAVFETAKPETEKTKKGKKAKKAKKEKTDVKEEVAETKADKKEEAQLRMIATVTKDGKSVKYDQLLPHNAFLSSYLIYIILQSKDGLKVSNNYNYSAIAEEDAKLYSGTAFVKEATKEAGEDGFKIVNEFKGIRFTSIVNTKGSILSVKSPLLSISTEAVTSIEQAVGKQKLEEKSIRTLFGDIPKAEKK